MFPTPDTTEPAFGDDLTFTRQTPHSLAGGIWVIGLVAGHRSQARVFPEHADHTDFELGDSRISKLWVQRSTDRAVVFNFDRGMDVPAPDAVARAVVALLALEPAARVFGKPVPPTQWRRTDGLPERPTRPRDRDE